MQNFFLQKLKYRFSRVVNWPAFINLLILTLVFAPQFLRPSGFNSLKDYQFYYHDSDLMSTGLNDTLEKYKLAIDSAQKAIHKKEEWLGGDVLTSSALDLIGVGNIKLYKQGVIDKYGQLVDSANIRCIALAPYAASPGSYFVPAKNRSYIKYVVYTDSAENDKGDYLSRKGYYAKTLVPVRFYDGRVLIPVTDATGKTLDIVNDVWNVLQFIGALFVLVIFPLDIIKSISRGKAFERRNVRDLQITGWCLVGYPIFLLCKQWVFAGIFHSYLVPQLHIDYFDFYSDYILTVVIGIVVLIIAKAFKRGYMLQFEQDLTI